MALFVMFTEQEQRTVLPEAQLQRGGPGRLLSHFPLHQPALLQQRRSHDQERGRDDW